MKKLKLLLEHFPAFFKAGTVPNKFGTRAVLLISAVLLLTSCQTKKQIIKTETEIKTTTEQQVTKTEDSKSDVKIDKTIAESISEKENTVVKETITKLSKPDSLGNQYPEEIINRETSSGKNSETKTDTKEEVNKASENKVTETANQVTDQELSNKTDSKTKIKKALPLKLILYIILFAGIVFLVIKFKNRIFKL